MGKKILLADDSITIQKVIELTFSDEDFDVVTVGNGRLALEKLPEVRPDIVLCDIIMPEKDGYEVCEQIKSSSAFSNVPVLLLTGAFEPFDQERASQVRSDGFLAKPFEPETLIAKVKDLLSRAGAATDSATVASPAVERVPPGEPAASSPGLIPDEPFAPIESGDFEEASPSSTGEVPLAGVTAEEAATLAGEAPSQESNADTSSTVMFNAGDLPWTGGGQDSGEPPAPGPGAPEAPPDRLGRPPAATETTEPEPVFTPETTESGDLADTAGAAFEEVLEEDLEFGGDLGEAPPPAGQPQAVDLGPGGAAPADSPATRTQAPTVPEGFGGADESPTLKVAVPAMPEGTGAGAGSPPERPSVETFEPATPEPPPVFAPEPSAPVEPEPQPETFEPAPEPPQVFAPEPSAPVEPVETFEPAAPEPPAPEPPPFFEPEPPVTAEPEPEPPAAPEPPAPEPPAFFEPEPPAFFEPEPPVASEPEREPPPAETFAPAPPEPPQVSAPGPESSPEPVESFEPMSPASSGPVETFEPVPPAAPEPIESFEPVSPVSFEEEPQPAAPVEPAAPPAKGGNVVETLPPTGPQEFAADPTPPPGPDREPQPEPVLEPEPEPTHEAVPELSPTEELEPAEDLEVAGEGPDVTTLPGVARKDVVESFADLGPGDEPDPTEPSAEAAPSSEAASVPVPVDMVEKIAQRVVSQVSEKAVREIAWEVIPDLAEALIKQEIERLKAELQKP